MRRRRIISSLSLREEIGKKIFPAKTGEKMKRLICEALLLSLSLPETYLHHFFFKTGEKVAEF